MKKHIFNKRGMTYVEMLVALALLALIVVSFTPMLLSSYDALYEAGVKTETVYKSKQEMEEGLAVRSSTNSNALGMNFYMNAQNMFETMNVTGRKIVSTLQDRLETVFHGVRARVDILTPDVVYDDTSSHDIILQTTGLDYTKVTFGAYSGNIENLPQDTIHIQMIIPEKINGSVGTSTDEQVYKSKFVTVSNLAFDAIKGRISYTFSGADFTQSPLKIVVYYKNERGYLKTLSDYLFIEPASMIFGGTTNAADYYTSSGVVETVSHDEGESEQRKTALSFKVEPRTMRLENSGLYGTNEGPKAKGVTIKTITWVSQDTNQYLSPYYVMAGTNGSVYRMYNLKANKSLQEIMGANNSVAASTDFPYNIDTGETIYPSFWSGEMSDQYSFQTMHKSTTYGNASDNVVDCSHYQDDSDWISGPAYVGTQYNKIDKTLRYSMMFNSFRTGYSYASQMSRKISYVLAEAGNKSFRIGGKKQDEGDFIGYHVPWEASGDYKTFEGSMFSANTSDEQVIYLGGKGALAATNDHTDKHMAYIRLNTYTNINPFDAVKDTTNYGTGETIADRFVTGGEFWSPPGYSEESLKGLDWKNRESYVNTKYGNTANVTSAVYLPGSGSAGQGQVIYFGTVPAYALIRQCSDIEKGETKVYNTKNVVGSAATMYLVCGTQGQGTTIYRNAYSGADGANKTEGVDAQNLMRSHLTNGSYTLKNDRNSFYTGGNDSVTYKLVENDLEFTLGYCSRWRMAIGEVTYNGSYEETKSYEKYYLASHPSAKGTRKPSSINGGGADNLYYNVWFPGEFYNLVTADTCDEVTVAVGYTVSGSTFMEQSAYASGYYGTALGSIYNDGVLAAYTSSGHSYTVSGKGDKTTIFKNLLYYKLPDFNGSLHSRESVRFVAVGVNTETTKTSDTAATKKYWAYYGDSNGNVYKSVVANANISYNASSDTGSNETTTLVNSIADNSSAMIPVTVNGNPMSVYFDKIIDIEAEEDIVIITGSPKPSGYNLVVVGTKNESNEWSWKTVNLGGFTGFGTGASTIIGGYYYAGGDGWIGAANLETLKEVPNGHTLPAKYEASESKDVFIYTGVGDYVYAIAGREKV